MGIKSLERSALRLKRKSTQNICVAKSSIHIIPKMISKSMWGEEMKSDIGFKSIIEKLATKSLEGCTFYDEVEGCFRSNQTEFAGRAAHFQPRTFITEPCSIRLQPIATHENSNPKVGMMQHLAVPFTGCQ